MAGSDVTSIYRSIIDEVITKSRHEFVQEDVDEAVLDELRVLWEEKLQQTGVLAPEPPRLVAHGGPGGQAVHTGFYQPLPPHIAAYYSAQARGVVPQLGRPNAYLPAGASALGPIGASGVHARPQAQYAAQAQQVRPPSAQQPGAVTQQQAVGQYQALQHSAPQYQAQQGLYQFIQGLSQQQQQQQRQQATHSQTAVRPQPASQQMGYQQRPVASYQQADGQPSQQRTPQQLHQTPAAGAVQYAYQQSNAQHPAGTGTVAAVGQKRKAEEEQVSGRAKQPVQSMQEMLCGTIPQQDGPTDGSADEASLDKLASAEADEEEAVDNLSDVPSTDNDEEEEISNHCISQYTKVSRTKNRWKAQLLAGILHLNGRDHIFHSAIGEFQF